MEFTMFYFGIVWILYATFKMVGDAEFEAEFLGYELKLGAELIALLWLPLIVLFMVVKAIEFLINFYRSI